MHQLDHAFRILFNSGQSIRHALKQLEIELTCPTPEIIHLIEFVKKSERGISRSCRTE